MRSPSRLLLPVIVLLATACGGDDPATVDAAVAEELAGRADLLAAQLEAGDACGARGTAGALVTVTSEARDAGTVPAEVAGEVIATSRDVVRDVRCEPEPDPEPDPVPPADAEDDEPRDERSKSDEGKDDEGEDDEGKGGQGKGGQGKGKDGDKDDD